MSLQQVSAALVLDSLVCEELSESTKGIGSRDDEVMTIIYVADKKAGLVVAWEKGISIFTDSSLSVLIKESIPLNEKYVDPYLVVLLIEQDTYLKPGDLFAKVDSKISFTDLPSINKEEIQMLLEEDDLLDAKAIRLNNISNNKATKTKLWGVRLFDEYEYWLYWHLE